ncbi:MAG: hypothetical protein H6Q55_1397 [Deltaproteobacteria bacterium]|nr:hypothetical protein [Deltaproteobacteria bacterium]
MKGGISILIVLIVVAAVSTGIAAGYPYLQAKIVPMLVGGAILLLSVVQLAKELRGNTRSESAMKVKAEEEEEKRVEITPRSFVLEGSWMVGFFFIIYILGFIGGIGVFTALYAGMRGARWSIAVSLGLFMAVLSYVLFSYAADAELFPGIILRYVGVTG